LEQTLEMQSSDRTDQMLSVSDCGQRALLAAASLALVGEDHLLSNPDVVGGPFSYFCREVPKECLAR
jgi:hypothetical protein